MIWLGMFIGFCAGTVSTALLIGVLLSLREEDTHSPYDWSLEDVSRET